MKQILRVAVVVLVLGLAGCTQGPLGSSNGITKTNAATSGKTLPHSEQVLNTTRKLTYLDGSVNVYFNTTAEWGNVSIHVWWTRSLPTEPGGNFPLFVSVKQPDGSSTGSCGKVGADLTETSGSACGETDMNSPGMWTIQVTGRTQKTLYFSANETDPNARSPQ